MITYRNQYESAIRIDPDAAFYRLSSDDQLQIHDIAYKLHRLIKSKHPRIQFTYENSVEVLAKIGVLLLKLDVHEL